jgi:hypothetical protein
MPEPIKVLAFDIGIRNLAWCLLETTDVSGATPTILGWENHDLLAANAAPTNKSVCRICNRNASFTTSAGASCNRHCPPDQPPFKDLSGNVQKSATLPVLRAVAAAAALGGKKPTRNALLAALAPFYSFPIEKIKVKKAVDTDMAVLHDAIRGFVQANLPLFRQATHILLENQPVLKNPTMKTVQVLLYATLRDHLQPAPPLKLVHAGKKIVGETTGDAGYKNRKDAAEAKVVGLLGGKITDSATHLAFFKAAVKKSDLADALCMCWGFATGA